MKSTNLTAYVDFQILTKFHNSEKEMILLKKSSGNIFFLPLPHDKLDRYYDEGYWKC